MTRAPALFLAHGAPTLALHGGAFAGAVHAFAATLPRPSAIAIVSAHWTTSGDVAITSGASHRLIYDFSGFPDELYRIRWPAPGAPEVAERAAALLHAAGFGARLEPVRGLDHGVWVPLRIAWPGADVPVVQLSLPAVGPERLLRLGAALAPLRDDGVLLVGSGGLVHNLARIRFAQEGGVPDPWAAAFDAWSAERIEALDVEGLSRWREEAPHAALAAPTPEHLEPVFVPLGARAPGDRVETIFAGFQHGNLAMRSFALLEGGRPLGARDPMTATKGAVP